MPSLNTTHHNLTDNLDVLGLSHPPFSSAPGEAPYFEEPNNKHCLDLLLHLGRYSELVLFVSGVLGSGKSTLLEQYIACSGENIYLCVIDADTSLDERKFEKYLTDGFGITDQFDSKVVLLDTLQERIELISRRGKTVVLLVDNIQKLSHELCLYLRELASIEDVDGKRSLHIIMFGEPEMEEVLNGLFEEEIKILGLSRYSFEDTKKYLQFRLADAGFLEQRFEDVFNSVNIHNIHQLANGLPARINKLAYNKLVDEAEKIAPGESFKEISYLSSKQWITAVFIFSAIVLGWVYQNDARQLFNNVENINTSVDSKPEINALSAGKDDVFKQIDPVTQNQTQAQTKFQTKFQTKEQPINPSNNITVAELASVKQTVINAAGENASLAASVNSQDWLLKQNPNLYTIQVFGSDNKNDIDKVLDSHLLGSSLKELAFFETVRKNKAWFSIVVGRFSDLGSAQKAVRQLPESLADGAWVRRYRSVHTDIKKTLAQSRSSSGDATDSDAGNQHQNSTLAEVLKTQDWLLAQDDRKFTLQLFGTNKEIHIADFVKQYHLTGEVAYYRTYKKGGQWFGLTYGVYPDWSGAQAAVENLPEKLKKEVWIRKLAGIHTEIQKTSN